MLFIDAETLRERRRLCETAGVAGLVRLNCEGSDPALSDTLLHGSVDWSRRGGGVGGCLQFPEVGCPPCCSKPTPLAGTTLRDNGTG